MHLHIKLVNPNARPFERNPDDPAAAGFDIFAPEDVTIDPLQRKLIKVGVKTEFTDGYVGLMRDRSGMGNKGITLFAGVIDSSYRGEWGVILYNSNGSPFHIKAGDKIAQVLFLPVSWPYVQVIEGELSESSRAEKGFGSSDKR